MLPLNCNGDDCDKVLHCNTLETCYKLNFTKSNREMYVNLTTHNVGHVTLYVNTTILDESTSKSSDDAKYKLAKTTHFPFVQLSIGKSRAIPYISSIVGWIYFAAWSLSFYPQFVENWRRKSVTGLNFDFMLLNLVGFTCYAIFNLFLYYSPSFKEDYFERYPLSPNPVEPNDVFFALHAVILSLVTISQIFFYERGGQKLAIWSMALISALIICQIILGILVATNVYNKLDYLYVFSYIKLTITLIKYMPQAWFNYCRLVHW